MQDCDYTVLETELHRLAQPLGAAEVQGVLMGMMCAAGTVELARWLDEVLEAPEGSAPGALNTLAAPLTRLHERTVAAFGDRENMALDLCLPQDGAPLVERVNALAHWCEGFMYGYGVGGGRDLRHLPEDAAEILRDIAELSRVEPDTDENEANEVALSELIEYLRVGVLVMSLALHPPAPTTQRLQ
ncbi:MAG: UPF0149 family protein [Halothiobacillaceae bacterium]|jgi:yecA family protein|nr:UPF0149 family protein [Halothiobacillaceae bacterium]MDY0050065.1 UPF0149 family protein [Halothiobacillaceae bacterium]